MNRADEEQIEQIESKLDDIVDKLQSLEHEVEELGGIRGDLRSLEREVTALSKNQPMSLPETVVGVGLLVLIAVLSYLFVFYFFTD